MSIINPQKNDWFSETVAFRKANLREVLHENQKTSQALYSIYQAIQPVGLINGQLFGEMQYPNSETWSSLDKTKVLFADCLLTSALLLLDNKKLQDTEAVDKSLANTVANISKFYFSVYPEQKVSTRTFFGQKKSDLRLAGIIIENRIKNVVEGENKFVEQFFHNGMLFLDIYIFSRWINTRGDEVASGLFKTLLEELRFSIVKIIAAAAHANQKIATAERDFLEYFLANAWLPSGKIVEARAIFKKGIEINELNLHPDTTWVVKKYFLEMAIVTIWADKIIDDDEMYFLERFCVYLELSTRDLENSLLSIKEIVPNKQLQWKEI